MNKVSFFNTISLFVIISLLVSCKKNYIIGGNREDVNMYKNLSTYDFLKAEPNYDTIILIINAAGLKDQINKEGITFFAPSNYSIYNYLDKKSRLLQITNRDAKFPLDSLLYYISNNIAGIRDSVGMYIINKMLTYSNLTNLGTVYPTQLAGDSAVVSYEYTKIPELGYNPLLSSTPRIVYYTHLWYPSPLSPINKGIPTRITTSGIATKTGMVHEMEFDHILFFYGTKR